MSTGDILRGLFGLALGGGILGLSYLFRSEQSSSSSTSSTTSTVAAVDPPPVTAAPVLNIGGAKDTIIPQLTGIQNLTNKYGPIPRVYGTYKMFPPLAAEFVTLLSGQNSYALGLFCPGFGELDITELKIGDTLLDDIDDLEYEVKYGTALDTDITLYTNDIAEEQLALPLLYNTEVTRTIPQPAEKVTLDISFDSGLYQINDGAPPSAVAVGVQVQYRLTGSGDPWSTATAFSANTCATSLYRKTYTWVPPTLELYDLKLKRTTVEPVNAYSTDSCSWSVVRAIKNAPAYRTIKDKDGNEIPLAWIALKLKSNDSVNGVVQQLNCMAQSKLMTYNGAAWVGPTATNNPAWIFADIICGTANARRLPYTALNAGELKSWADYCDDNGYEFNYIYDSSTTIPQALAEVCAAGRAAATIKDGQFSVVVDQLQATPRQLFTALNSSGLLCRKEIPDQPHALRVSFVNPDNYWQRDEVTVYDDGYAETAGTGITEATKFESLQLIGCTSRDLAWKHGRYALATARLRRRTVQFTTDYEHLLCTRGDLIRVEHDSLLVGLGRGRVQSFTTNDDGAVTTITGEYLYPMLAGHRYGVRLRLSDLVQIEIEMEVTEGESATLTLMTPWPQGDGAIAIGDLFAFGEIGAETIDLVIQSIEYQADLTALITAVDAAPGVYDADTGAIPPYKGGITPPPIIQRIVEPPVVLRIVSNESALPTVASGIPISRIQLNIEPPTAEVEYFETQIKRWSSDVWSSGQLDNKSNGVIYITGVDDLETYNVRIRCRTYDSRNSEWVTFIHTVIGKTTPPPDVPYLDINGDEAFWRYDASVGVTVPLDFDHFELRCARGDNGNWDAMWLVAAVVGTRHSIASLPAGTITLGVKAVDVCGNYSTNARILKKDLGDPWIDNIVIEQEEHPDWTGTIVNGTVIDDKLLQDAEPDKFYTTDDAQKLYSADDSVKMYKSRYREMTYTFRFAPDPSIPEPFAITLEHSISAESYAIDYKRVGSGSLFYDGSPGADALPFYGSDDGADFYEDRDDWAPMPGQFISAWDEMEIRATLNASHNVWGRIIELSVITDVPDIEELINDLVLDAAGTRLPLTKSFYHISGVTPTLVGDATYPDAVGIKRIDLDRKRGPLVQAIDSSGNGVAAKIDARIKGY